jgi:23S rRNA pseudouridine2605 synthase
MRLSLTVEQLEAARAERMRQNGHGAITIEDVRTWIEETGLCIFLPRSAQAGYTAPTFVEAVAGQRTTEPTLELIATAESLLVRLEAEGVAVRLNLAGQPHNQSGDQPDYVVASWVLPYIYALRGDRDWRRSPQLTGSRQVSQLAVLAAKQLDSANMNASQIRDALGREVTETAVLRALHELWKQLRIIPVVPEVGKPALWQPLRQRFQKAIAEGASTSQVTAISVLASIYLQAVIAASMEDVELFLSPLTSRSKIREVVRGLAATRQVHTTAMGHAPMFYVAGTLPEFPATPSFQISTPYPAYRGSSYLGLDHDPLHDEDFSHPAASVTNTSSVIFSSPSSVSSVFAHAADEARATTPESEDAAIAARRKPLVDRAAIRAAAGSNAASIKSPVKSAPPRPRTPKAAASARSVSSVHPRDPRERSRTASASGEARSSSNGDRRRAPAPRSTGSNSFSRNGNGTSKYANGHSNGNGKHSSHPAKPAHSASNGHAHKSEAAKPARSSWNTRPAAPASRSGNGAKASSTSRPKATSHPESRTNGRSRVQTSGRPASGYKNGSAPTSTSRNGVKASNGGSSRPSASRSNSSARPRSAAETRKPAQASAAKRYSFAGQAKQAPKPVAARASKPASKSTVASKSRSASARPAPAKRRG